MDEPELTPEPEPEPSLEPSLAPWWKRAAAYILDALLVGAPVVVLGLVTGLAETVRVDDRARIEVEPVLLLISATITVLYSGFMDGGPRRASVGKMALRIQVRDASTDEAIGVARAASRRLVYIGLFAIHWLPGVLNALFPLLDARRQGLHDKAVRSIVVNAAA